MKILKMRYLCVGLSLISSFFVFGQFSNFYYGNQIPVIKAGDTLSLAWTGGMNHPQFATIDVNYDGKDELVTFEPDNGKISVFKRMLVNNTVVYLYQYDAQDEFPAGIINRMQLFDFNHDGKKDLFTYSVPSGMKVYENVGSAAEGLQWKLKSAQLMSTDINNNPSHIYTSESTIPALNDIDGDGDMDILTFAVSRKIVEWHKNLSVETYGNPDSLIFKLEQPCWGDFAEASGGNGIVLNATIAPCETGSTLIPHPAEKEMKEVVGVSRHLGGGSILALDINGNGLKDVLIGDHDYDNLTLVVNGGTDPSANANMISVDPAFPSYDTPVNLSNFLAAYYEDIDLDNVKDLIATTSYVNHSNNTKGVWYYKNTGTNEQPHFVFQKEDLLQGEMIDNGQGSIPVFADVNNDGLLDLLVANSFNYADSNFTSRINYFRNIGTSAHPVFELSNSNWNAFANSGLGGRISPAFGDLDGDGDEDMIVGTSAGKLYYYENAGGNNAMLFNVVQVLLTDDQGSTINTSGSATPEIYDLNQDGKLDLVIGQGNGPLLFYKNVGSSTSFSFKLVNSNLGSLSIVNQQNCVPRFYRTNGSTYLFVGNSSGTISLYDDIDNSIGVGGIFNLVTGNLASINTKSSSAPAIAEIKNNGTYNLLVGNQLGGVWNFTTDSTFLATKNEKDFTSNKAIHIYPNPNNGSFTVDLTDQNFTDFDVKIFDPMGRIVYNKEDMKQAVVHVLLPSNNKGLFFIKITPHKLSQQTIIKKIIVH